MKALSVGRVASCVAGVASCAAAAVADWPSNPATNVAVSDVVGEQTLPKLGIRPDAGLWISWFDNTSGNYNVYIQRLSPRGMEMFPHNGVLVSNFAQPSSLVDYDCTADSADGAVVAFTEAAVGSDRDARATRIAGNGAMAWSTSLSNDNNFEADPRVIENSMGEIIVVWPRFDANPGLFMQRLDRATGAIQLAAGGLRIAGDGVEAPAFQNIIPSDNGSFIMVYVRDTRTFLSPRNVYAQKYTRDGVAIWNGGSPVILENVTSVPIAHRPSLVSDQANGAYFTWHDTRTGAFNCWVQRVTAAGVSTMPAQGAQVVNNPAMLHLDPAIAYEPVSDSVIVFFSERDSSQGMRGILGQRLSPAGVQQWGATGLTLVPVDALVEDFIRAAPAPGGAECVYFSEPTTTTATVQAFRVNTAGAFVWPGSPRTMCSVLSNKGRLPVAGLPNGALRAAWEDNRLDPTPAPDIYAQNLNPDGSIGIRVGDINGDGTVNAADLALLLGSWGPCPPPANPCPADLDGDGVVGASDLALLLGSWG